MSRNNIKDNVANHHTKADKTKRNSN